MPPNLLISTSLEPHSRLDVKAATKDVVQTLVGNAGRLTDDRRLLVGEIRDTASQREHLAKLISSRKVEVHVRWHTDRRTRRVRHLR